MPADTPAPEGATPTWKELKVWPVYASGLEDGSKTFEFRRDDRVPAFAAGDLLRLREWQPVSHGDDENGCLATFAPRYTGREWWRRVTYVARGGVIPSGYCVMSIASVASPSGAAPDSDEPAFVDKLLCEYWNAVCVWEKMNRRNTKHTTVELSQAYERSQVAADAIRSRLTILAGTVASLESRLRDAGEREKVRYDGETNDRALLDRTYLLRHRSGEPLELTGRQLLVTMSGDPAPSTPSKKTNE